MTEIAELRERIRAGEVGLENLKEDLAETRKVLHATNNALQKVTSQLDALTNQGKGATMLVRAFLAVGGLGWLAALYNVAQSITGR